MQTVAIETEEPGLFEKAGEYAETQLQLLKYRSIDKGAAFMSSLISRMAVFILVVVFLLLLNIGVSIWVGSLVGEVYWGFFIVAAFYGVVALLLHSFRSQWVKKPLNDLIVRKILTPKP